jgi:F-type H+-transporting ATPase subunit b
MSQNTYLLAQVEGQSLPAETETTVQQATEVPAESGGAFPPFQTDTFASQILWLALTFGALYFLMSRFALPRVGSILEVRRDRIATDLGEAQRLKEETEAAIATYEAALAEARSRAQSIAAAARAESDERSAAERRRIEADLAAHLSDAENRIAASKASALTNVRTIAVEAAGEIVARLTGRPVEQASVEQAVDATLKA